MKKELEIEFKNLLTKKEYQNLMQNEFFDHPATNQIMQVNHYFDTSDKLLKKKHAAVRIRSVDADHKLTFKIPAEGFLMENTFSLNNDQVQSILNKKEFSLNEITNQTVNLDICGITKETIFYHFNSFETLRHEKKVGDNLVVLDQTTFQNGSTDYELEVESLDSGKGRTFFNSFLDNYSIPTRPTLPKIARAENNK